MGKLAITRPVTITMFTLFYVVVGIAAYLTIPRELFPKISSPSLKVVTQYHGASAGDIEEQITKKLEERLAGVKGVTRMNSSSGEEKSEIFLEFDFDTDLDFAAIEVREKLDQVEGELPEEAEDTLIERWDASAQPVLVANVTTAHSVAIDLRRHLERTVRVQLERIPGVASVQLHGGDRHEVRLEIDRDKLKEYHLSLQEIEAAFARENVNLRSGRVADSHTEFLVRTVGKMASLKDIEDIVIARNPAPICLKNVLKKRAAGALTVTARPQETIARLHTQDSARSQESVQILLLKKTASDTVAICEEAREILDRYLASERKSIADLAVTVTSDQSRYIEQSLDNIKESAVYGIVLAVVVLLVFLRSLESTVIIALSMPISVIAAFSLFYGIEMGLNLFSMAGLTLAVGMVVDNAIVVIESVFNNRSALKRLDRAILFSLTEVGPPVVASTLTTLAVFIPLLFVKGFIGQIFRDLSWTIIFTLSFSLLVAFTLIPMLLYRLLDLSLRPLKWVNGALDFAILGLFGRIARAFLAGYDLLMKFILRRWNRRLGIIVATGCAFALSLFAIPPSELMPDISTTELALKVVCPVELNLREKDAISREVEHILAQRPEVEYFATTVSARELKFAISLDRTAPDFPSELRREIRKIPDIQNVSVGAVSPLDAIFESGSKDIAIEISGPDLAELEKVCARVKEALGGVRDYLTDIEDSVSGKKRELVIQVVKKEAADRAISTAAIAQNVATAIGGKKVCEISLPDWGRIDVELRLDSGKGVEDIPLKGVVSFPLKDVAKIHEVEGPGSILREERGRVAMVWANIRGESDAALGTVVELLSNGERTGVLDMLELPQGYKIRLVGGSEAMEKSFTSLVFALLAAVVFIYMIMAAQFESLLHPFAIMFSLPLAGIGAFFSLYLMDLNLSTPAFIGLILLAGIVVNNAIILIDYTNILRARGHDRDEAILAAGKTRMRPICMTTATTVVGMLPMALAAGEGAVYRPLAVVVIGGLTLSTLLTLVFIPTIYCFFDDIREFVDFAFLKIALLWSRLFRKR